MFSRKRSSAAAAAAAAAAASPDSFVGLVSRATSEMLLDTDWSLVMQCCDTANTISDPTEAQEGIRLIRKQIQSGQHRVIMHGLVLLESLVKNCSENFRFLSHIANEKLMKSMVRLVQRGRKKGGKDNLEAMEKVLDLIQSWGESYVKHQDKGVRLFVSYYHSLRVKGVVFPRPFKDNTAIFTPKARKEGNVGEAMSPSVSATPPSLEANGSSSQMFSVGLDAAALRVLAPEYQIIASTVDLLQQSLASVDSREAMLGNDVVSDLMSQLNAVHPKVMQDLEVALLTSPPPPSMAAMMQLNDLIHATMKTHAMILENGVESRESSTYPASAAASSDNIGVGQVMSKDEFVPDNALAQFEKQSDGDLFDNNVSSDVASVTTPKIKTIPKLVQPTSSGRRRARGRSGSGSEHRIFSEGQSRKEKPSNLVGKLHIFSLFFSGAFYIMNRSAYLPYSSMRLCKCDQNMTRHLEIGCAHRITTLFFSNSLHETGEDLLGLSLNGNSDNNFSSQQAITSKGVLRQESVEGFNILSRQDSDWNAEDFATSVDKPATSLARSNTIQASEPLKPEAKKVVTDSTLAALYSSRPQPNQLHFPSPHTGPMQPVRIQQAGGMQQNYISNHPGMAGHSGMLQNFTQSALASQAFASPPGVPNLPQKQAAGLSIPSTSANPFDMFEQASSGHLSTESQPAQQNESEQLPKERRPSNNPFDAFDNIK